MNGYYGTPEHEEFLIEFEQEAERWAPFAPALPSNCCEAARIHGGDCAHTIDESVRSGRAMKRRPRSRACPLCGERTRLILCGVDSHLRTRTRREQIDGRCPGRVYAHVSTGAIDTETCPGDESG
jgi:hypothetical protein